MAAAAITTVRKLSKAAVTCTLGILRIIRNLAKMRSTNPLGAQNENAPTIVEELWEVNVALRNENAWLYVFARFSLEAAIAYSP